MEEPAFYEEYETRGVLPDADAPDSGRPYDWQRVLPEAKELPSGRLAMEFDENWHLRGRRRRFADRQRWKLDDKLGEVLAQVAFRLHETKAELSAEAPAAETTGLPIRSCTTWTAASEPQGRKRRRAKRVPAPSGEIVAQATTDGDEVITGAISTSAAATRSTSSTSRRTAGRSTMGPSPHPIDSAEKWHSVAFMCAQHGVVREGYYRWLTDGPCQRKRTDAQLTERPRRHLPTWQAIAQPPGARVRWRRGPAHEQPCSACAGRRQAL